MAEENEKQLPGSSDLSLPNDLPSSDLNDVVSKEISQLDSYSDKQFKNKLLRKKLCRKAKIEKHSDWIRFYVSKSVGISSLVIGILEFLIPTILAISIDPFLIIAFSLALLTQEKSIDFAKIILYAITQGDNNGNNK